MHQKPFFSVIIPTLNEEVFLPKLLNCLLDQTETSFEIIVVDAQSVDNTVAVARSYRARFKNHGVMLQVLHSPQGKTVGAQRNSGAAVGRGAYFVFLDADVGVDPSFLTAVRRYCTRTHAAIVTTTMIPDSSEMIDQFLYVSLNLGINLSRHMNNPYLVGCDIIVARWVFFALGGFNEILKQGEDWDFAFRSKKANYSIGIVKDALLTVSTRRFRREGRITVVIKSIVSLVDIMRTGRVRDSLYPYHMGGSYHLES